MPYLHARVGYFSGVKKKLLQIFRIEKPFGMTFLCIMVVTFLKMPGHNLKRRANIFYETFLNVYSQAPYMLEILIFQVA